MRNFLFVLIGLLIAVKGMAVMPPSVYKEAIKDSKIKIIGECKQIKITGSRGYSQICFGHFEASYEVNLETKKIKKLKIPVIYKGEFERVNLGKTPPVGGTIYYYPMIGSRYFVTISDAAGKITSMTHLKDYELKKLLSDPSCIKVGMGQIDLETPKQNQPSEE